MTVALIGSAFNQTHASATNLTGGVIAAVDASGKDSGKLTLSTGSLSATDIRDSAKSKDVGIGVSASINDPFDQGAAGSNTPVIDGRYASSLFKQDKKATIGQGQLIVAVPSANVTINRDIGQSQVVTKDKETGFTVYIDESAIRETVALLKGDTQNSTILQGVDVLANNPLKPLKDVINEVQSFSDHLPESGALERLVTGIDRLTSGNNAVNLQQIKALADDPRFGTLETPEAIAAVQIEDKAAFVERTAGKEAADRFRAEANGNPAIYNLFLTDAQAIIALRNSGGAITEASQLVDVQIGALPSLGSVGPDEIIVDGKRSLGDAAAQTLVAAQHYLDTVDPTLRSILELGLAIGKGPVGAVGSFALDKAVTEFAKQTGLDKKAAQLVVGIGTLGLSFLSSSELEREEALVDAFGPDEAATLTNAGITILGVASLGKAVANFVGKPKLIEIDIDKAVKGTKEFDLLNSALQPNTIYKLSDGTSFKTSKAGYVEELTFVPKLSTGTRDARQTEVGKLGKDGDVGGHVQACSLGGSCDRFNLFPQDATFNNSSYKRFENDLRKALARGDDVGPVTVKFVRTDSKNPRPDGLEIKYKINGQTMSKTFKN